MGYGTQTVKPLGISHISAANLSCDAFLELAAASGFDEVSLFVTPAGISNPEALVTKDNLPGIKQTLERFGLAVRNVECLMLTPRTDINELVPLLELANGLGARNVGAVVFDNDKSRVLETLSCLSAAAVTRQLGVCVEFMSLAPRWGSLETMIELVSEINSPAIGITVDILHLIRSGGLPGDLRSIDKSYITHAQLCDSDSLSVSNDYAEEASGYRLMPGEGQFPLREFLEVLREKVSVELEVPQQTVHADINHFKKMMKATRELFSDLPSDL